MSLAFIEHNWYLVLALVVSGALLVWPLVQRRLSPLKELGNLEVTRLINSANAVLIDVRMAPGAIPLTRIKCGASSCATLRINSMTPPFEAA